jgi:rubredoxin
MMMKLLLSLVFLLAASTNAFTASSFAGRQLSVTTASSSSQLKMIFGGPKDDGSPGDYVCKDCGYVFTKGPKAWAELPSNWGCPPCGSAKNRFKKVPKGSAKKAAAEKKSWFGN